MILSALQTLTGFSVTYFSLRSLPVEWFLFHAPHSLGPDGGVEPSIFPSRIFNVSAALLKLLFCLYHTTLLLRPLTFELFLHLSKFFS